MPGPYCAVHFSCDSDGKPARADMESAPTVQGASGDGPERGRWPQCSAGEQCSPLQDKIQHRHTIQKNTACPSGQAVSFYQVI